MADLQIDVQVESAPSMEMKKDGGDGPSVALHIGADVARNNGSSPSPLGLH